MKQLEQQLSRAVGQAPLPDASALLRQPVEKMQAHDYITQQAEKPQKQNTARRMYGRVAAACCALVFVFSGLWFSENRLADTTVTLDINPSIELITNRRDQVISLQALNSDAQGVVEQVQAKGLPLKEAVDALLSTALNQGYLSGGNGALLVSVQNEDPQKAQEIKTTLDEEAQAYLSAHQAAVPVVSQVMSRNDSRSAQAQEYSISEGKLRLIKRIQQFFPELTIEQLAPLDIDDLLEFAEECVEGDDALEDLEDLLDFDDDDDDDDEEEYDDDEDDHQYGGRGGIVKKPNSSRNFEESGRDDNAIKEQNDPVNFDDDDDDDEDDDEDDEEHDDDDDEDKRSSS